MPPRYYFAYGSNMLRQRLLARNVHLLDNGQPAVANGFKLLFNKRSDDGSGKANLRAQAGEQTWGVLFTVDANTLDDLDAAEAAPEHYVRTPIVVTAAGADLEAMSYLAQADKVLANPHPPYEWYLALVLAGTMACPGIPQAWRTYLRHEGHPIPDVRVPRRRTFIEAVAQLAAAGHENWQDLLNPENH